MKNRKSTDPENATLNQSYISNSQDFSFCSNLEKWRGYRQYLETEKSSHIPLQTQTEDSNLNFKKDKLERQEFIEKSQSMSKTLKAKLSNSINELNKSLNKSLKLEESFNFSHSYLSSLNNNKFRLKKEAKEAKIKSLNNINSLENQILSLEKEKEAKIKSSNNINTLENKILCLEKEYLNKSNLSSLNKDLIKESKKFKSELELINIEYEGLLAQKDKDYMHKIENLNDEVYIAFN